MVAHPNAFLHDPARQDVPGQCRLLLVSADPTVVDAAGAAARHLSAWLEVMPTLESAFAWLLHPAPTATHVLASGDLPPSDIDALAGMVDEVTGGRARLFLLGGAGHQADDGHSIIAIDSADATAIEQSLRAHPDAPPPLPDLDAVDLRAALHDGRLRVRFQPVLDAQTLSLTGVEALSRLHHRSLGILRPAHFMPQAIATGQDRTLSSMAAARAVMDLRDQSFMRDRNIAFNVPMPTFLLEGSPAAALEICAIAAQPAARVVIELVETNQPPDLKALGRAAERWRAAGFRVMIDDAGPRLPHWRALLDLPFNGVKLDGSLAGPTAPAMAEAATIVAAAKKHGQYVVAEGIEDAAAMTRMRALGVDALQGFFFCRPVPAPALKIWAEAWQAMIATGTMPQ